MFYDSKNRNKIETRNKIESKWRNIMKIIKDYRFINMKLIYNTAIIIRISASIKKMPVIRPI